MRKIIVSIRFQLNFEKKKPTTKTKILPKAEKNILSLRFEFKFDQKTADTKTKI